MAASTSSPVSRRGSCALITKSAIVLPSNTSSEGTWRSRLSTAIRRAGYPVSGMTSPESSKAWRQTAAIPSQSWKSDNRTTPPRCVRKVSSIVQRNTNGGGMTDTAPTIIVPTRPAPPARRVAVRKRRRPWSAGLSSAAQSWTAFAMASPDVALWHDLRPPLLVDELVGNELSAVYVEENCEEQERGAEPERDDRLRPDLNCRPEHLRVGRAVQVQEDPEQREDREEDRADGKPHHHQDCAEGSSRADWTMNSVQFVCPSVRLTLILTTPCWSLIVNVWRPCPALPL